MACARDDEADTLLMTTRRDAARVGDRVGLARLEIAMAAAAVVRDDDAGAEACLREARRVLPNPPPSVAARAWIVEARRAYAAGPGAPEPPPAPAEPHVSADDPMDEDEHADLAAELALGRAIQARATKDIAVAHDALCLAQALVEFSESVRLVALVELEAATFAAVTGDQEQALTRFRAAADRVRDAGLRRDAGRAMIRFADMLVAHGGSNTSGTAASWLGRAEQALGPAATWRDRLAIRSGLRRVGRRGLDRAMTDGTSSRIEVFERARGVLVNSLSNVGFATDRVLTDVEVDTATRGDVTTAGERVGAARTAAREHVNRAITAVTDLDQSMRDLVEIVSAALFERDRLRMLLGVLAEIDKTGDEVSLPSVVASLAVPLLDADRIVIAVERAGVLTPVGEAGTAAPGTEDEWQRTVDSIERRSDPRLADAQRFVSRSNEIVAGPRMFVPIRGREARGLLYGDKLRRSGKFREQDEAIAHLLAEYVALAFDRLHAREQERFALNQLAVTLDTIRDGVIACDASGVVISSNATAARMLRFSQDELRGVRLDSLPQVGPLWSLMVASPRPDGAVVRLAHASFVVTARPISDNDAEDRGFVATLVELDRAQKLAQRLSATRARYGFDDIVGTSPALKSAVAIARRAVSIDTNVLINGESGTGKEVIAQAIHTAGPRANEPFIGVNCAAVPRELLEAELFGYEKGAFTGARSDGNAGKFEIAAGGTILLDEIGDMPLEMQAKLLRVLQERVVTRLGGRHEVEVHARVIATTHRELAELVDEGKFRMDLYYRLRVLAFELPPLRDRLEDIPLLARHFLLRFAEQQRKRLRDLGPRVQGELERYDWPGNVRELANVMEAEVSLAAPDVDVLDRLATRLVGRFRTAGGVASTGEWRAMSGLPPFEQVILPLADVEKRAILSAIELSGGSVSKAADALGVSKVTIYAKLRAWGMHPRARGDRPGDEPQSWRVSSPHIPGATDSDPGSEGPPSAPSTKRSPIER
jgi:transcriptional regulator with PAS, ATPase and Fis domain